MEVQAVHDRVVTRQGAHKLTPGLLQEMVRTHHVVVATVSTLIQKIRETLKSKHDMRKGLLACIGAIMILIGIGHCYPPCLSSKKDVP